MVRVHVLSKNQYCIVLTSGRSYYGGHQIPVNLVKNEHLILVALFEKEVRKVNGKLHSRFIQKESRVYEITYNNNDPRIQKYEEYNSQNKVILMIDGSYETITATNKYTDMLHKDAEDFLNDFITEFGMPITRIAHPVVFNSLWDLKMLMKPHNLFDCFLGWKPNHYAQDTFMTHGNMVLWSKKKPWFYKDINVAFKHCLIESLLLHGFLQEGVLDYKHASSNPTDTPILNRRGVYYFKSVNTDVDMGRSPKKDDDRNMDYKDDDNVTTDVSVIYPSRLNALLPSAQSAGAINEDSIDNIHYIDASHKTMPLKKHEDQYTIVLLSVVVIAIQRYAGPYPVEDERVDALDIRHVKFYTNTDCEDMIRTVLAFMQGVKENATVDVKEKFSRIFCRRDTDTHALSPRAHDLVVDVLRDALTMIREFKHPKLVYGYADPDIAVPRIGKVMSGEGYFKQPKPVYDLEYWMNSNHGHVWGTVVYNDQCVHVEGTTPLLPTTLLNHKAYPRIRPLVPARYQPIATMTSDKITVLEYMAYGILLSQSYWRGRAMRLHDHALEYYDDKTERIIIKHQRGRDGFHQKITPPLQLQLTQDTFIEMDYVFKNIS